MNQTLSPQTLDRLADFGWGWAAAFVPHVVAALVILALGVVLARWLSRGVEDLSRRTHLDETLRPVLATLVRYAILMLVLLIALAEVGVQTASLLAVVGAAGLAVGLALQGTLSNIAAGLMLLWLRPFRAGDFIEAEGGIGGRVREIGLFASHLETFDGLFLFVPNSLIWNKAVRNHTRNPSRLVSVDVTLSGTADIGEARRVLIAMAERDRRILSTPTPQVFVESLTGAGLLLNLIVWTSHENLGEVQRDIIEQAMRELAAAGIETLQPQQVVRAFPTDSDPFRRIAGNAV